MRTLTDLLAEDAARIKSGIEALMAISGLHREREYEHCVVISADGNHLWDDLPLEGRRLQSKILDEYGQYRDLVRVLIQGLTSDGAREFEEADDTATKHVEQQRATWYKTVPRGPGRDARSDRQDPGPSRPPVLAGRRGAGDPGHQCPDPKRPAGAVVV